MLTVSWIIATLSKAYKKAKSTNLELLPPTRLALENGLKLNKQLKPGPRIVSFLRVQIIIFTSK